MEKTIIWLCRYSGNVRACLIVSFTAYLPCRKRRWVFQSGCPWMISSSKLDDQYCASSSGFDESLDERLIMGGEPLAYVFGI
eukprot:scaffold69929_cov41-Attheya_sp.AAC.1